MNKIMILCLMLAIFASCDKEDIMRYDRSRAAIEFDDDDNLDFRLFTEKTFAKKKSVQFDNNFINEISGELRFQ